MLAIDVIPTGGLSEGLVVVTSPSMLGAAADDVFITRNAVDRLLVATDSSFSGVALQGNHPTPDILYVTNGAGDAAPGPMAPGNNRTPLTGGPGYRQDVQASTTMRFVLGAGDVNLPEFQELSNGNRIINPNPPAYPGAPEELNYLIERRVTGTITYDGGQWSFEEGPSGEVYIRQDRAALSRVSLQSLTVNRKAGRTAGLRADILATWSAPIATVEHNAVGVPQPPTADVSYTLGGNGGNVFSADPLFTRSDLTLRPSAVRQPSVSFDVFDSVGTNAGTTIIEGTLRGTVAVDTFNVASEPVTLYFPFTTDINGGTTLYFGSETVGQNDWLNIRGRYDPTGTIFIEFRNRFNPDGDGPIQADSTVVFPGPVRFIGPPDQFFGYGDRVTFAKYVTPQRPNDFTLWAGYDLTSQLWADLRCSGSTVNIDSPVITATPAPSPTSDVVDLDLRSTTINLNAQIESRDRLYVGPSRSGVPSETLLVNTAIAVPDRVDITVDDDANTVAETRSRVFVSRSGSIASSLGVVAPPFGSASADIRTETEPNDSRQTANDWSGSFVSSGENAFSASLTGSIAPAVSGSPRDVDVFKVTVRANDVLTLEVNGITLGDPTATLLNDKGQIVAYSDDYNGRDPFIRFANGNASADYFIQVSGFGGATGSYELTAQATGAPLPLTQDVLMTANAGDIQIEGRIFAVDHSYLLRSDRAAVSDAPYSISTTSPLTGAAVGQIRGETVQVLLANDGTSPYEPPQDSIVYHKVDLSTAVQSIRIRSSIRQNGVETSQFGPFPYDATLAEEDDISIDAVAASSQPLRFASDGKMTWNASLATAGDLQITTKNIQSGYSSFVSTGPISTSRGSISIAASDISLGALVAVSKQVAGIPTRTDIVLTADSGGIDLNSVLRSPNRISLVQQGKEDTRVAGVGRIKTANLSINAVAVGQTDAVPTDARFYMRTDVDSLTAEVQRGCGINELTDIAIPYLRAPAGLVAIRAEGYDFQPDGSGGIRGPALTASMLDVGNLFVTAANGSINVRNDSGKRLQLGMPTAILAGSVETMRAAGNVTIINTSGGVDVYDAPVAGSGARRVDASTTAPITNYTYAAGVPGQTASTIEKTSVGPLQSDLAFAGIGRVMRIGDRLLVKNMSGDPKVNGVYTVTRLGSSSTSWKLTRAGDSDTVQELPTNTVVYDSYSAVYWQLTHAMTVLAANFGAGAINVAGVAEGFSPATTITPELVVPVNDLRFVVSSSNGTNLGSGSLGKMIRLRQDNVVNPAVKQSLAMSRLLQSPIQLVEELPRIRVPLTLDAGVQARFLPPGTTAPAVAAPIVINGQLISATRQGAALFRATTTVTVTGTSPTIAVLPAAFGSSPSARELKVGMTVSGNGVNPGTTITGITTSPAGVTGVTLSEPVVAAFNSVTNSASLSLTFATEINGLSFTTTAGGSRIAAVNIGGFGGGAAVRVLAQDPDGSGPARGVTLEEVNIGSDGGTPAVRLGNLIGVLAANTGDVSLVGGQVTSNSVAGVRTRDSAVASIYGTVVGTQALANYVGLDLGGSRAEVGRMPNSLTLPNPRDTFVEYNRRGIILKAGTNVVQNTQINGNSFEGISVEGGTNQIGNASRTRTRTGQGLADSNVIVKNGTWGLSIKTAALAAATKVFDNVFGSHPTRTDPNANTSGNVAIGGVTAPSPFVPNATTLLDSNGNQHGGAIVSAPSTGPNRPWQPRS